jgi:hypothetical protein
MTFRQAISRSYGEFALRFVGPVPNLGRTEIQNNRNQAAQPAGIGSGIRFPHCKTAGRATHLEVAMASTSNDLVSPVFCIHLSVGP